MNKVFYVLVVANIAMWGFNAGTMYTMLEPISDEPKECIHE